MNIENLPEHCRIAVPPGVGDVYWVLSKMKSFREKNNLKHVTFCVQKTQLTRAMEWPHITEGLVDAAEEFNFKRNPRVVDTTGFSRIPGVDCVLWPNTIVDKGLPLAQWMPRYELDLDFEIKTPQIPDPGVVIYASSIGVNEAWFPGRGPQFWSDLIMQLIHTTHTKPTLIGAGWDIDFTRQIRAPFQSLVAQTNLPEVAAVLRNAKVVIGIISGMTILANHFGTPTVAIWPDFKFPPGFPTSWCRPGIPYFPIGSTKVQSVSQIIDAAFKIAKI